MMQIVANDNVRMNNTILGVLLVFAYKAILDYSYINFVSDSFSSAGFGLESSVSKIVLSYGIVFIISLLIFLLFDSVKQPSSLVIFIYYLFVVIPMLTLYGMADTSSTFLFFCLASFLLLVTIVKVTPVFNVLGIDDGIAFAGFLVVGLISMYVYSFFIATGGIGRLNFNLYNVYEVRAELSGLSAPLMGYLLSWQANVINMGFLVFGLITRSSLIVFLVVFAQLLLFGMTNFKSFLFAPFFVTFIFFFFSNRKFMHILIFGLSSITIAAYLVFLYTDDIMLASILIRRLFFVPAQLHVWYFDFFSHNPFVMLSNSILSPVFQYPYDMPITRVISWEYLGEDGGPNVGFLGDAYAHFGFIGMLLFSTILGLFLKIVDSISNLVPANFCAAVIAIPAMSLINSAFFTVLLTHGFLFAVVCLWLFAKCIKQRTPNYFK